MTILKGGGLTVRQTASIELFLRQLKLFVEKNSIIIVKREASVQFLASRGVSARGLEEIILNLTPPPIASTDQSPIGTRDTQTSGR